MTSRDLFNELSNIDEALVEEAGDVTTAIASSGLRKGALPMRKNWKTIGSFVAAAACVVLVVGGIGIGKLIGDAEGNTEPDTGKTHYVAEETVQGTYVIYVKDFVYFEGNTYIWNPVGPEEGLDKTNYEKGELIGEVGQNPEYGASDYVGCPVYGIRGRKGTAKLLVEKDGELKVFRLNEWGKEPDIADYMRVYGITEASDIVSVKLSWNYTIGEDYTGNALIEDSESISAFYNILKDFELDTKGYNAIVDEFSERDHKAWVEAGGNQVYEDENGGKYTLAYEGTTAFNDMTYIRIVTGDNEQLSLDYYPKIGYVNRFKAPDELVSWLDIHKN